GTPHLPQASGPPLLRTRILTDLVTAPRGLRVVWNTMDRLAELDDLFVAGLDWEWERTTRATRLSADRLNLQRCGRLATNGNGDWGAAWLELPRSYESASIKARTFGDP